MWINKNKTILSKKAKNMHWYIIDAKEKTLGRLSSKIAYLIQGKHHVKHLPHEIPYINIIIINSQLIHTTGKKRQQKIYKRHSGKPGGLKLETFNSLNLRLPNKVLEKSIKGMLPKNTKGKMLFTKLKIYSSNNHPHEGQKPIKLD